MAANQGLRSREIKGAVIIACLIASVIAGVKVYKSYRITRLEPAYTHEVPRIKWSRPLDRTIWATPILGKDEALYVPAAEGVHAIDPSGAVRWVYRMDEPDMIMGGSLLQDEAGNLYVPTSQKIYSLSNDGLKRWQVDCPRAALAQTEEGRPQDASALFAACDKHFAALGKDHGEETWRLPLFETERQFVLPEPPLILRNGHIIFAKNARIYATDHNGTTLWIYPPDDLRTATLLGAGQDDIAYAANLTDLNAIDINTGTIKWTFHGGPTVGFGSSPVTAPNGRIYVVAAGGPLYALAPDGTLLWMYPLPSRKLGAGYGAPALGGNGTIYVLLESSVTAVSSDGKLIWHLDLPGPPISKGFLLLAADGTLYVVSDQGMIHAVQTASHG